MSQKSLTRNVMAKGVLNIFNILLPLLITPYIYRRLGPDSMGLVEYGTTLYTYFGLLGLLGIYNYGLREISSNRSDKKKVIDIYKNLFTIGICSNLLFLGLYIVFVTFFINDPVLRSISYILCGNLAAQIFYVEWINEAYEEFQFITIKTVIIRLLSVGVIFIVVKAPQDCVYYTAILVVVLFLNYIVSYIYAQKYIGLSGGQLFRNLNIKEYIVPLLFILVLNNTSILYTLADRTMLGAYTGAEEVAFYSIGQKIVEAVKALLLSVVFVTLPRLSLYLKENMLSYKEGIRRLMRLMLMIIIPSSIGMYMLSEQIVMLFAGPEYAGAVPAMRIFSLRVVILGVEAILYNQIIFLHRKEKVLVLFNLICGGLNVFLNFLLLKYFTPFVAILTTLVAEIVFESLCLYYIKTRLHIDTGLFNRRNRIYLFLSLIFIPVILLFRVLCDNQWLFVGYSVLSCAVIYIFGLYLAKDEVFIDVLRRFNVPL